MFDRHVREALRHLIDRAPPQPGGSQHVGLVHRREALASVLRGFEGYLRHALNLRYAIDHRIPGLIAVALLIALPEVYATGQFADEEDVHTFE